MHYVFKVEKPSMRLLYYTGEANHVWSEFIENAESLTEFQANAIAKIAKAHPGHTHKTYARRKHWTDDE